MAELYKCEYFTTQPIQLMIHVCFIIELSTAFPIML